MSETDELKERIAELEAERDHLQAKVAHLDKLADLYPISLGNACDDRDKLKHSDRALRKENAALRKALEWYASPKTWNQWCPESFAERAREALTALPTDKTLEQSLDHGCNSPVSLSEDKSATDLRQSSGKRAGNNTAIAHEDIEDSGTAG